MIALYNVFEMCLKTAIWRPMGNVCVSVAWKYIILGLFLYALLEYATSHGHLTHLCSFK